MFLLSFFIGCTLATAAWYFEYRTMYNVLRVILGVMIASKLLLF